MTCPLIAVSRLRSGQAGLETEIRVEGVDHEMIVMRLARRRRRAAIDRPPESGHALDRAGDFGRHRRRGIDRNALRQPRRRRRDLVDHPVHERRRVAGVGILADDGESPSWPPARCSRSAAARGCGRRRVVARHRLVGFQRRAADDDLAAAWSAPQRGAGNQVAHKATSHTIALRHFLALASVQQRGDLLAAGHRGVHPRRAIEPIDDVQIRRRASAARARRRAGSPTPP